MTGNEKNLTRELRWESDNLFRIDDVTFIVETGDNLYAASSKEQTFVIGKSRRQLETIQGLEYEKPVKRIFDLGIYKGGSVMFYHKLFAPDKIVAIELDPVPVEPLEAYVRKNRQGQQIRTYYGVDQADQKQIQKILSEETQGQFFDMVVDDASHSLKETRASFNMLLPHVAPGGYYIIEDWGWAHWEGDYWQAAGGPWSHDPPLSNLIFEVAMLLASRPFVVESVFLLPAYAVIKRGTEELDRAPGGFDISSSCLNRGNQIQLLT